MLFPRMTRAQRDLIASPAPGLLIFQTNSQPGFYFYTGSTWTALISKGPDRFLSNLTGPTSINVDLLPNANNARDLGSGTLSWNELYVNTVKFMDGTSLSTAAGGGGAETDPQVGANSLNCVPRWDGTALVTGKIQDDGLRIGVGGEPTSTARASFYNREGAIASELYAVRGVDQTLALGSSTPTEHAIGYLGYNSVGALFLPVSADHTGVWGRHSSTLDGIGTMGWTSGTAPTNYGVTAISTATGSTNYGLLAKATGAGAVNRGIWAEASNGTFGNFAFVVPEGGGFSGFGWTAPTALIGIKQDGTNTPFRVIGTDFATDFVVTSAGKVGINADPTGLSSTLSVNGTAFFSDKVGINTGTATSLSELTVNGVDETVTIIGTNPYVQLENAGNRIGYVRASGSNFQLATNAENDFGSMEFRTNGSSRMWIDANGNVSVSASGAVATGYKFNVDGKIMCEELKVQLSPWPDYVFKPEYTLKPLAEVKAFIQENHRLPGIPAASAVESEGLNVGEMQKMMMEKIEELTLYILELDARNQMLTERISELEK